MDRAQLNFLSSPDLDSLTKKVQSLIFKRQLKEQYGVLRVSEVKCYHCGKAIVKEEDITMKNVSLGWFRSERKPFHPECWRKYHGIRMKKDAIGYVAIADGAILLFGLGLFMVSGTLGIIVLGSCLALFIGLGVAYYRIED